MITNQPQCAEAHTNGKPGLHSSARTSRLSSEDLREIVREHCVCYEVWPEWSGNGRRPTRIGFAISLCGVHENGVEQHDMPGCPRCWGTYTALRALAEWVKPEQEKKCRFEIPAYDRSWHVAPNARHARNETVATIKIFHRRNIDGTIDGCQQQCLTDVRQKLAELGIRENVWAGC